MADEFEITKEDIAALREIDPKWKAVELSIRVDTELRDSAIINLVIIAATRRAEEAKEALADIDPTDTKKIISLQADVQRAKLIGEILRNVKTRGDESYAALMSEQTMVTENRSE